MKRRRSDFAHVLKGYVALQWDGGPIIWGSLRPTPDEARKLFLQWNPGLIPVIRRIRLEIDQNLTEPK